METYLTIEGDTVDLIAWNRFGETKDATEAILKANPGLAAKGTSLPAGVEINIPAWTKKKANVAARIWS
jgi:phage tail protein X